MAEPSKREISGFFLSTEKFASYVTALADSGCTITHLRLFHNEPHHTAAVVDAISRNASVTNLDIFELDHSAAEALAAVLATSPRLTALAVHHPHSHDAVLNLCRGISASRTLSSIHLSQLNPRDVTALANALLSWAAPSTPDPDGAAPSVRPPGVLAPSGDDSSSSPPRLKHLRLEKCSFNPAAAAALAEALGRQAGALTQLEIVESDLGDAAAEALMAAPGWAHLASAGALNSLDVSTCHIGRKGAEQLGRFLARSDSLRSLSLANNRFIGCEGARSLAAGLSANRTLRHLDLTSCGVGATGVTALAAALRPAADAATGAAAAAPVLEHLALGENAAGAAGLAELMLTLSGPRPCALRLLQLNHNHIRGADLPEALSRNASQAPQTPRVTAPLKELSLAGNALYDPGVKLLAEALTDAPCLEQLDLRENGISDAGVAALLPLVAPAWSRRGSAGGAGTATGVATAGREACGGGVPHAGREEGLQGLLLDGNRLHNAGAQALLDAVTAAPGLWKFSVEGNKLTDPALRLSLSQLSQLRAARHSQLLALGRHYSSSSSTTSEDGTGGGGEGQHRGSGGGGAAGGRKSHEATSPMDVDGGGHQGRVRPPAPGAGRTAGQQQQQQHKHRLEEAETAAGQVGGGGGDDRQPLRKVAARSEDGGLHGGGGGGSGAAVGGLTCAMQLAASVRQEASRAWSGMPPAHGGMMSPGGEAGGGSGWCGGCVVPSCNGGAPDCRGRSSGGGSSADCSSCGDMPMLGTESDGSGGRSSSGGGRHTAGPTSSGALACCSSPPATCFVTASMGVGGATSVGLSKRVGCGAESNQHRYHSPAPQQVLPACRRPRYKPLTPEQQRLFEDF